MLLLVAVCCCVLLFCALSVDVACYFLCLGGWLLLLCLCMLCVVWCCWCCWLLCGVWCSLFVDDNVSLLVLVVASLVRLCGCSCGVAVVCSLCVVGWCVLCGVVYWRVLCGLCSALFAGGV